MRPKTISRAVVLLCPLLFLLQLSICFTQSPPQALSLCGKGTTMALAAHLTASSAGTAWVNGNYTLSGVADTPSGYYYNGNSPYINDANPAVSIHRATDGSWFFHNTSSGDVTAYISDLTSPTDTPTSDIGGGWFANGAGVAPAPLVTLAADTIAPVPLAASINSAGTGGTLTWTEAASPSVLQASGHGTSQGLTLTSSAGLVTISAVSTTGTTTTFTTSRTVGPGEVLSLAGDAGSFTDSATAHNASAAFSLLAVTNNSTAVIPGAPTNLAGAASYGPVAVVWSWLAPLGPVPDSYKLYTGQYPGSETLRQSGIAALSFTDASVVKGRPTSAYVSAVKGGLEGPASLRVIFTVLDQPIPCQNCPSINSY